MLYGIVEGEKRNLKLSILNRKLNSIFREHEAFCFLQNNENIGGSDNAKSKSNYIAKTVIKKQKQKKLTLLNNLLVKDIHN